MEPLRKQEPVKPKRKLPEVKERPKARVSSLTIPLFRVIFHDDNKTSFQFVELVSQRYFNKTAEQSKRLAAEVHKSGSAIAGVYALEHAETRRDAVLAHARDCKFPFQVSIEPEL